MPFDFETVDSGATAWVLASAALVLLMTPGLAFFYGGLVRSKNVLGMLMQNFVAIALVGLVWVAVGFTLAFGGTETASSATSTSPACRTWARRSRATSTASPRSSRRRCSSRSS